MICNMLTTGAMARLGYVYGNLMVQVQLKNAKLVERGIAIVQRVAKVDRSAALQALDEAEGKVPVALVMLRAGVTKSEAVRRLRRAGEISARPWKRRSQLASRRSRESVLKGHGVQPCRRRAISSRLSPLRERFTGAWS